MRLSVRIRGSHQKSGGARVTIVSAPAQVWLFLRGASPRRARFNQSLVPSPAMMYGSKTTREEWYGALANAIVEAWTGNVPGRKGGRVSLKQSSLVTEQSKAGGDPVNDGGSRNRTADKVRLSKACRGPRAWHGTREESGSWEAPSFPAVRRVGIANSKKATR